MDSLHAIGFYVSSAVSITGALIVALLSGRAARGAALGVTGVGLAGIYVFLSAGFAAVVALICYAGCAFLLATPQYRSAESAVVPLWRQLGAIGSAGLLAVLAYSAFLGDFVHATFYGGWFGSAAIGRLLFAHDALGTEAVGALAVVALVGATAAWRIRERHR
jgi:NADH:ubiquinone oxidoreductase subunit 6 (subunit J)